MADEPQRDKTIREREIDELLTRAGEDETAWQLQHRMREDENRPLTDVQFTIRALTGAQVSVKSMSAWWDTEPANTP